MALNISDKVYHKELIANGEIVTIDNTKLKDKYGVLFSWGTHLKDKLHNLNDFLEEDRGYWCSEDKLVKTDYPTGMEHSPIISTIGDRILERKIRATCGFKKRERGDDSDIIIVYGQSNHSISPYQNNRYIFIVNRFLTPNKFQQNQMFRMFGKNFRVPESISFDPNEDDGWIAKPHYSFGGKKIWPIEDDSDFDPSTHYAQRYIKKVREFRAHVFLWADDPVPLIQEKIVEDSNQLCWNRKQGGHFYYRYQPKLGRERLRREEPSLYERIVQHSINAVKILKMDFGGVDLIMDEQGFLYILEVNSRMGLREQNLFTYKDAFWQLYTLNLQEYEEKRWI